MTPTTNDGAHPLANMTDDALQQLLWRAFRYTAILGALASIAVWIASGWRNAAMLAAGAAVSSASIFEWRRLVRIFNAILDRQSRPRGAVTVVLSFVIRLTAYAAVIYGSLKCFQGSAIALLCGLSLAVAAIAWEALRSLRG